MLKRIENIYVIIIILLSTSLYSLSFLGPVAKGSQIAGILLILVLLAIHIVYSEQILFKHNFKPFIALIFISLITSTLMAKFSRDQSLGDTMFAQRALFYYLFYFLLHQLKIKPGDLEKIFIFFGLLGIALYLVQFFVYPKVIFQNVWIRSDRGTIRVYMQGTHYVAIAYLMSIQAFLRTNKIKYLILILLFYSNFILLGGRQTMAIMLLILVLFLIFSKKVKSRFLISLLIAVCIACVLSMFQGIFTALLEQSNKDTTHGKDYIRFLAIRHYMTDFFKTPLAYITGNGMYSANSAYGMEMLRNQSHGLFIGDIGLIGNYALYGPLFVIGVLGICFKSLLFKIQENYVYIRYMFIVIIISLFTGGGFVDSDFIVAVLCLIYIIDVSNYYPTYKSNKLTSTIH
jgi:hypothetical protein